jgi:DNA-binding winged helix-turn-helix (wHTH) protein/Tol biopolymer transport system component
MVDNFQIGDFILVPSLNQLHSVVQVKNEGQVQTLEPKVIDLLLFFAQQPNRIASREDIRSAIWGNITVSDHAINRLISQLRKALSDNKQPYQYIETLAKRGYRLVAKVSVLSENHFENKVTIKRKYQHKILWLVVSVVIALVSILSVLKVDVLKSEAVLQIDGGTIKQISALPGREWLPKYSKDGKWLTFLHFDKITKNYHIMLKSERQALAFKAFSTDRRITDYYWLPEQNRLFMATFDGEHCLIEQLEFSAEKAYLVKLPFVVSCGQSASRAIAWSPIDNKLYWLTGKGELHRQALQTQQLPFSILDDALVEKVAELENIYQFSLSENGQFLALLKHHQWEKSDIELYNIAADQQITLLKSDALIRALSWNNPSEALIFVADNKVSVLSMNGHVTDAGFNSENDMTNMHYAANQSQLLYASSTTKYQLLHLQKEINGGYQKQPLQWHSQVNERNPVYSHSGKSIAFISQRGGQYGIAIKQDGEDVQQLKLSGLDLSQTLIRWSPDDQQLLFHSKNSLFVYSLVTEKYQQITDNNIYADVVAWSYRSPENIYFRSDIDGQMNIWLVNIDTGTIKPFTENGGYSGHESQDGQYFYYTKENEDGLWKVSLVTGEEVLFLADFSRRNHLSWFLVEHGLYYLYSTEQVASIYYYAFDSKKEQLLWRYEPWLHGGFTISPDQQHIYLGLKELIEWNIMSVNTK